MPLGGTGCQPVNMWLGGPPPLEVGEAMNVAHSITILVRSTLRTRSAAKPSLCHRLPHVPRTWATPRRRRLMLSHPRQAINNGVTSCGTHLCTWKVRRSIVTITDEEHCRCGMGQGTWMGGPPPLEVGEPMNVADSITIFVRSAVRTGSAAKPSVCHRLPHLQRTWATRPKPSVCHRSPHVQRTWATRQRTWATRRFLCLMAVTLPVLCLVSLTVAQRFPQAIPLNRPPPAQRPRVSSPNRQPPPILIEPSAPILNLFERAEEGLARADWKFAIDCLQRIVEDPSGSLSARWAGAMDRGVLYESVRLRAIRRLGSLPPEAQRTYRLLFDGKAKRLLEQGWASRDPGPLRTAVRRYPLTQYGQEAADLLSSMALDEGRPYEVIRILSEIKELAPNTTGESTMQTTAKLAAAYAMLGRRDEAGRILQEYSSANDNASLSIPKELFDSVVRLPALAVEVEEPSSWPYVGGSGSRRAQMPLVEPTLTDRIPWWIEMPDTRRDDWRRILRSGSSGPVALPIGRLVADDRCVYARTRNGCMALDRNDLSVVWEADCHDVDASSPSRSARRTTARRRPTAPLTDAGYAFEDPIAGSISIAHGLVMIISRGGRAMYTMGALDAGDWDSTAPRATPRVVARGLRGTRLIAYDLRTGRTRWQRGRSGHPDDPLDNVTFRSTPIAVGDVMWVPYVRGADLHVAVLDPEHGSLIRDVPLYPGSGPGLLPSYSLEPACIDDVVFIPSGRGLLFAIEARDFRVRWAVQIGGMRGGGDEDAEEEDEWLPSPPVVSGGLVLLTPNGHDDLLAFSAADGGFEWSSSRDEASYIIAADDEHVWLGGRSVECLSLSDGQRLWSVEIESAPSGRAVLSGGIVQVPTLEGLHALHAGTGEKTAFASLSSTRGPLGNILCLGGAMYDINSSYVRRFPDISRTYPVASARLEADPQDATAAVGLAWLQLLQNRPRQSYDILDALPASAWAMDERLARQVAHVRVEALLDMAGRSGEIGRGDRDVLALLEQAYGAARSGSDRLRCTLAIADELHELGRVEEACQRLWALGVGPDSDQTVLTREHVEETARIGVTRRLRDFDLDLTDEQRSAFHEYARLQTEGTIDGLASDVTSRSARTILHTIADLGTPAVVGQWALNELASHRAVNRQYAKAEMLLRQSARIDAVPALTATCLMDLCRLHVDAATTGLGLSPSVWSDLEELEYRFGDLELIGDGAVSERTADNETTTDGEEEYLEASEPISESTEPARLTRDRALVGEWAQGFRSRLTSLGYAGRTRGPTELRVRLSDEVLWSVFPELPVSDARTRLPDPDVARVVRFDERSANLLGNRVLLHDLDDSIACYEAETGEILWRTSLRIPGRFIDQPLMIWPEGENAPRLAVAEGQTAVIAGREGLFAIGLATGRRLWVRPFVSGDPPAHPIQRANTMSAGDGFLAAMPAEDRLTLIRMSDGSTVWERDLLDEPVEHVRILANRVVTADGVFERVHLFDLADGRLVRRVLFDQPDLEDRLVDLVEAGGLLCGPAVIDGGESVLAIDPSNGEEAWRLGLDKPLASLFKPQDGYLAVGLQGGDVRLVDAASGEVILNRRVSAVHAVIRGTLIDGTLVAHGYAFGTGARQFVLAALDVATGEELWRRVDLSPLRRIDRPLRVVGGQLPVVIRPGQILSGEKRHARLATIDVRTGKSTGASVRLPSEENRVGLNGDFEIFWGRDSAVAVVGTHTGIHALRLELDSESVSGESSD